jgi:magnesium transporter
MTKEIIQVRPHTKLERAAYLAVSHNIKAVPVVDHDGRFLGIVTNDTILDTLYREMQADIFSFAGIRHPKGLMYKAGHILSLPFLLTVSHRFPWLLVGLVGGLVISKFVTTYTATLESNILLAAFLPLIVYISDAVGTQLNAFIIRDFAINPSLKFASYFARQFLVTLTLAFVISYLTFVGCALFYGDYKIALVVSIAMFVSIISSVITGLAIPYLFEKMKMDPADASGPVGTIIQDGVSVIIYLSIASYFL